jgi:hypothetical protein
MAFMSTSFVAFCNAAADVAAFPCGHDASVFTSFLFSVVAFPFVVVVGVFVVVVFVVGVVCANVYPLVQRVFSGSS